MTLRSQTPNKVHTEIFDELNALLRKHTQHAAPADVLALAANMVGKLIALQDQKSLTGKQALEIVSQNIQIGNKEALALLNHPTGTA